ncbi:MAG: rhodanese-like domain-containing protein [Hyphomicrobiaceae bacterium]
MTRTIDAKTLKTRLAEPGEMALIDVQEPGPCADGHLLFAVPIPYSRFELDIERLVPRTNVPLVLCDGGDGMAEKAAARAQALGYSDVSVLAGGTVGWKAAGYTLYAGVNVPSKTFGELVEHERHTPRISATDFNAMRARGEKVVLVDGRPIAEHKRFTIPGSICCPNGELALRIDEIVADPTVPIVVNCAGRTRSIIGAETLRMVGVTNPVYALENGTQGWFLAGLEVEKGADRIYPAPPQGEKLAAARARAKATAARFGVPGVTAAKVLEWLADTERTTCLIDVRTAEEFQAGSLPGAIHAPGGQLIQATDQWIAVRNARIVLLDSEGVRAPVVGAWLRQLGHDVHVLEGGTSAAIGMTPRDPVAPGVLPVVAEISPADLKAGLAAGSVTCLDLRASAAYRAGHVPGSRWSIRPHLAKAAAGAKTVVLVVDDTGLARLAAVDLAEAGVGAVRMLAGGLRGWQGAGNAVDASPDVPADSERIDFVFHTHRRHEGDPEAARQYLAWEMGLVEQLDAQERAAFRL